MSIRPRQILRRRTAAGGRNLVVSGPGESSTCQYGALGIAASQGVSEKMQQARSDDIAATTLAGRRRTCAVGGKLNDLTHCFGGQIGLSPSRSLLGGMPHMSTLTPHGACLLWKPALIWLN